MLTKAEQELVQSTAYLAALGDPRSFTLFVSGLQARAFVDVIGQAQFAQIVHIVSKMQFGELTFEARN